MRVVRHSNRVKLLLMALLLCTAANTDALAQTTKPAEKPQEQEAETTPKIKTLPPAYNDKMLRLAEILGSIHYLRELCGAGDGMVWREQMENVIESEEPTPERKAALIGRFNHGFRSYREIYRECTPTAVEAVNLYMQQGTKLAGEIPSRYGR